MRSFSVGRMPGWMIAVLFVLCLLFLGSFLISSLEQGGSSMAPGPKGVRPFPFAGTGLLVWAVLPVVAALIFFWLLWGALWRKHHPMDYPDLPLPERPEVDGRASSPRREELSNRLDMLERALLEGRISEETYRELRRKYEEELSRS